MITTCSGSFTSKNVPYSPATSIFSTGVSTFVSSVVASAVVVSVAVVVSSWVLLSSVVLVSSVVLISSVVLVSSVVFDSSVVLSKASITEAPILTLDSLSSTVSVLSQSFPLNEWRIDPVW